jgi:hypothetical protein
LSNGIRWFAPDIYNGATVYTPDEMGAVTDEEGNVIEGKAEPVTSTAIDPEEIYNESAAVVMKIQVRGKMEEKRIGDMSREQLDWVIRNAQVQKNADAAAVVMQHDYGTKLEPELEGTPEGQLL